MRLLSRAVRLQFGDDFFERESLERGFTERIGDKGSETTRMFIAGARLVSRSLDERPDAATGLEDARAFELAVHARDGVGVDPQVHGELADSGQLVARLQPARGDCRPDTSVELSVDGRSVARIDVDHE